jgi:hypothetical protein
MLKITAGRSFIVGIFDVDTGEMGMGRRDGAELPYSGWITSFYNPLGVYALGYLHRGCGS